MSTKQDNPCGCKDGGDADDLIVESHGILAVDGFIKIHGYIRDFLPSDAAYREARERAESLGLSLELWFLTAAARELAVIKKSKKKEKESHDVFSGAAVARATAPEASGFVDSVTRRNRVDHVDSLKHLNESGRVAASEQPSSLINSMSAMVLDDTDHMEFDEEDDDYNPLDFTSLYREVAASYREMEQLEGVEGWGEDHLIDVESPFATTLYTIESLMGNATEKSALEAIKTMISEADALIDHLLEDSVVDIGQVPIYVPGYDELNPFGTDSLPDLLDNLDSKEIMALVPLVAEQLMSYINMLPPTSTMLGAAKVVQLMANKPMAQHTVPVTWQAAMTVLRMAMGNV